MNILAFDCSQFETSIALMIDDKIVHLNHIQDLYSQDALLIPTLGKIMAKEKISFQDLSLIATTSGPGSFTGIRLGIATAVGLSLASDIPAAAFNVLDWYAHSFATQDPCETGICVLLESKRADLYARLYDCHGQPSEEPTCLEWDSLEDNFRNPTTIIGTALVHQNIDERRKTSKHYYAPDFSLTAADLCLYAKAQIARFGIETFLCEPFYLTNPHITMAKR